MNNQGWAAEILISSIVSREIYQGFFFFFFGVGHFGAYRLFVEYSYLSSVVVCSRGETTCLPFKVLLAHAERTHWSHTVAVWMCAVACLLCVCVWSLYTASLHVWVCMVSPHILRCFIWGMCCNVQRELYSIVYGGWLHKQGSFNALWERNRSAKFTASWTCVTCRLQSSLVTLI